MSTVKANGVTPSGRESRFPGGLFFNKDAELKKHAWYSTMTAIDAEAALSKAAPYTYLTRPCETGDKFALSFVNLEGDVEHHYFTLINPKYGIWRNHAPHHVGMLDKVIRDMMECGPHEGQPL